MDFPVAVDGGEFNAGNTFDVEFFCGFHGFRHTLHRIMVSQGHGGQTCVYSGFHNLRRRTASVGSGGMGM